MCTSIFRFHFNLSVKTRTTVIRKPVILLKPSCYATVHITISLNYCLYIPGSVEITHSQISL